MLKYRNLINLSTSLNGYEKNDLFRKHRKDNTSNYTISNATRKHNPKLIVYPEKE